VATPKFVRSACPRWRRSSALCARALRNTTHPFKPATGTCGYGTSGSPVGPRGALRVLLRGGVLPPLLSLYHFARAGQGRDGGNSCTRGPQVRWHQHSSATSFVSSTALSGEFSAHPLSQMRSAPHPVGVARRDATRPAIRKQDLVGCTTSVGAAILLQ
jgi:hypothetical protein